LDRRRFLKYVGAGAVAAGGAAAAYYLRNAPLGREPEATVPTITQTATTVDYPPYPDFKYRPYYLNPTDQQTIQFTNTSYDLGGDPLTHTWLVDKKVVSHEGDYSTKLSQGEHVVDLQVSDGKQTRVKSATIAVDPDQIYPVKPLHLKCKGVNYFTDNICPEWSGGVPNPTDDEMEEQLDTLRLELGCNAICVNGGLLEDRMIECGQLAAENGFQRVYILPRYMGASVEETVDRIGTFARKVKPLREASDAVVYCVGHEFGLETSIVKGNTWFERLASLNGSNAQQEWNKVRRILPKMFKDVIDTCKANYGHEIAYASIASESSDGLVPWEDPIFESVGVDAYVQPATGWTEDWIYRLLQSLKRFGRPVHSMETGCMTFSGAGQNGGNQQLNAWADQPYDEDEQANYIGRYCELLNRARIDGYFYTEYNDNFDKGYGLYNGKRRKKGFYVYKSYQRSP
jgi:hypothetical protein